MRPLVLTLATDGYDAEWRFCLDSQRRYCDRLGYEHRVVTEPVAGLNGKWSKLRLALEALHEGRDVLVLDADAEITALAPPFVPVIAHSGQDIAGVLGASARINSGVMMLSGRADSCAAAFLAACLAERDIPVPREDFVTPEGENGHVIHVLRRDAYAAHVRHIEPAWNCSVPEGADEAYVRHYTGHLRSHLYEGAGLGRLIAPWPAAEEGEARRRGEFRKHYRLRKQAMANIEADEALFAAVKRQVTAMAKLEYPEGSGGDANGWLWRLEVAQGIYKLPTVEFLRRLVRPADWFVDGGAHIGYFTNALLDAGVRPDRLLAVEAHPANAATLRHNLEGGGVLTVEAALGGETGSATFHQGSGHGNSSLFARDADGGTMSVRMETLDALAERHGIDRLGMLKLDIEGAEALAITGGEALLRRSPDAVIVIESDPRPLRRADSSPLRLLRQLNALGFVGRMILDDFSFGPAGVVLQQHAVNVAFARSARWDEILRQLRMEPAASAPD